MLRSQFVIGLLTAVLMSFTPIICSANTKSIVLNKTLITDFFKGVSIEMAKPIVVSSRAGQYRISGEIDLTSPYDAIKNIANKTNLIWYDDGSAIYVYASSELRNEFFTVKTQRDFNQLVKFLKLSNLYSDDYPLRYTKGAVFASGPPMYVDVIQDAVTAYYNGLEADKIEKDAKPKPVKKEPVEVIKIFPLKNRFVTDMRYYIRGSEKTVDGALTVLKRLISERTDDVRYLNIVADTLNNSLYVKGKAKEVEELKKLINKIDTIREQIQLSLWIIDVDSSELKEVGTSFEGRVNSDIFTVGLNGGSGSVILDHTETLNFVGAVNLLETERKAKVLSRPVLITQNNTPAVIDTNETIYVKLIGAEEVSLKEITYGTILSVTPRVVPSDDGSEIEMMVEIEDGNQTADLIDGLPNIRRSVISTVGRIKDSQSLLLGGFVRKQITKQNRGIPFLKDIPIIKYLFSMDVQNTASIMRLFMIEPKIIEDPVAEFNRSRILGIQQAESFTKGSDSNLDGDDVVRDPMTGRIISGGEPIRKEVPKLDREDEQDNLNESEEGEQAKPAVIEPLSSFSIDAEEAEPAKQQAAEEMPAKQKESRASQPFMRRISEPTPRSRQQNRRGRPSQGLDMIDRSIIERNQGEIRQR